MKQQLAHIALVVDDYDQAIEFYTKKLHFELVEDTVLSENKRWVVVAPPGGSGCSLLLAKASGEEQRSRVGNQTESYGTVAVFKDLYGNLWDLIEPA
jgi:catechol 2,3-dioxygenase-like lactoylglutathione lyase family enzyme